MKPLLALAIATLAVTAPAPAQKPSIVVPVALYNYGYAPSPISLRTGVPVTMQFTNRSRKGHTFKAPAFFAAAKITGGSVHDGEIHLKGGQSASVTLIPARGRYPVHCSHFMHDQLGMHSTIYVQ